MSFSRRQHSTDTTTWWMDAVWSHYPCCLLISPLWQKTVVATESHDHFTGTWQNKCGEEEMLLEKLSLYFCATVGIATAWWRCIMWYPGSESEAVCKLRTLFSTFPSATIWKINKKLTSMAFFCPWQIYLAVFICISDINISTFPRGESQWICFLHLWASCHVICWHEKQRVQ